MLQKELKRIKREEIRKVLGLDDSLDIINVESDKEGGKEIKYVYIKSNRKKDCDKSFTEK